MRQQGDALNDPDDAERAFNARNALDTLRNVADWFGSVRGRRKTILFVSEGIDYDINDMIAAQRLEPARRVDRPRRHARHDRRGDAVERQHLRHRSARPHRSRRRVDRDRHRFPTIPIARRRPRLAAERIAAVAGQPPHAVRGDRRLRRRQQNDYATAYRSDRRGQQLLLRAGLLPARRAAGAHAQDRRPGDAARAHRPRAQGLHHAEEGRRRRPPRTASRR